MAAKPLPIYDINNFNFTGSEADCYANTFPDHLKQHSGLILAPHKHVFYLSVLFTKGTGVHTIDFNAYPIVPGSVFLLSPGQVHDWQLSKDIDGFIIFHNKEFYNLYFTRERIENYPFFASTRNTPMIILKAKQAASIAAHYKVIVAEYRSRGLMKCQKICALLNALYIDLTRAYLPVEEKMNRNVKQLEQIRKLEKLIEDNFKTSKYPRQYAQMMYMTEKNLNRISKITLGKTTSEIILDKIILEAKRMLAHSGTSVTEIATELGYPDSSYFARVFKKRTGRSPLKFLETYRGNETNELPNSNNV